MSIGIAMAIAVVFLLLGLCIGFLAGTRGRQILATAKIMHKALKGIFSLKIPLQSADEGNDDGEDNDIDGEDEFAADNLMEQYLNTDSVPGLEDHPDLEVNPVILHFVRKAKDRQREEKKMKAISEMRDRLIAAGFSEDEIVDKLAEEANSGGGAPVRQNALAVLIASGARVEATAASGSAESQALQERRRRQKNIDVYLSSSLDIEVAKTAAPTKNAKGVKLDSAIEVCKRTEIDRFGGGTFMREQTQPRFAKVARNMFRDWKSRNKWFDDLYKGGDSDGEGDDPNEKKQERRGGGKIDATDLASLQAEFAGLLDEDEGEDAAEQ